MILDLDRLFPEGLSDETLKEYTEVEGAAADERCTTTPA